MPVPLELADRNEKAVLWVRSGTGRDGMPTVGAPVEIDVRWMITPSESIGPNGEPVRVDAQAVVAQVIPIGSEMWEGSLEDWNGTGSGLDTSRVFQVVSTPYGKDLKGRITRRTVGLVFAKRTPPG